MIGRVRLPARNPHGAAMFRIHAALEWRPATRNLAESLNSIKV